MDEYKCECDVFPVSLQISFWFSFSIMATFLNINFIDLKMYNALTRFPFWCWILTFLNWYITFPFIIYYGIQKPECGLSYKMIVFVLLYIVLSLVSLSFFKYQSMIATSFITGSISVLMICLTIILSASSEWWSGILMGVESIFAIFLFVCSMNLTLNPYTDNIIKFYNHSADTHDYFSENILREEI